VYTPWPWAGIPGRKKTMRVIFHLCAGTPTKRGKRFKLVSKRSDIADIIDNRFMAVGVLTAPILPFSVGLYQQCRPIEPNMLRRDQYTRTQSGDLVHVTLMSTCDEQTKSFVMIWIYRT